MGEAKEHKTVVLKFGSATVADAEHIRAAARKVRGYVDRGCRCAVIVSSMGDTASRLLEMADGLSDGSRSREVDELLAAADSQSMALLSLALRNEGISAAPFSASQAGFRARGFPTEGRLTGVEPSAVREAMSNGRVALVAGYQATTDDGGVITLGRGGADLSAVALAASLGGECHILSDVGGIFTADPRVTAGAIKLREISYSECMELSTLGARIVAARCVELAERCGVPTYVASGLSDEEGTWIVNGDTVSEGMIIKGVTSDARIAKVVMMGVPDVPGIAGRLFARLAERGVGVEMIIQNNMRGGLNDIGFLVRKELVDCTIDVCRAFSKEVGAQGVSFNSEMARVAIVGAGIANHPDIPSRMFEALADEKINIDMIASTAMSVICVVAADRADDAVRALHRKFIEEASEVR